MQRAFVTYLKWQVQFKMNTLIESGSTFADDHMFAPSVDKTSAYASSNGFLLPKATSNGQPDTVQG